MQFKKLLFFIISVAFVFSGCDSKSDEQEDKKEVVKKEQTKFSLSTIDSQMLNLEIQNKVLKIKEIQNKAVLLNFWATWCPPCKVEIPHLINLKEKYKDDFEVIAVNIGDRNGAMTPNEKIKEFAKEYKINYIITNSKENLNLADTMEKVSIIPTMFLFDKEGNIVQKYVGVVPQEMIETDIKKAIGK